MYPFYKSPFEESNGEENLKFLLDSYSEDVTRMMEKEVFLIKREIQSMFPEAKFIEIQPHCVINKPTVYQSFPQNINKNLVEKNDLNENQIKSN